MSSFIKYVVIFAALRSIYYGINNLKWSLNSFYIYLQIINLISEIIINSAIAYKFPLLFVSWIVLTSKEFKYLLKKK